MKPQMGAEEIQRLGGMIDNIELKIRRNDPQRGQFNRIYEAFVNRDPLNKKQVELLQQIYKRVMSDEY